MVSTCAGRLIWGIHRCQGGLSVAAGSLASKVRALFPQCLYPQLVDILIHSFFSFLCTGRGWRPSWRPTPFGGPPCALSPLKISLPCRSSKVSEQRNGKKEIALSPVERAGEEGIKAAMHFAVCPAAGMSHTLLSSWLKWEDTEQRGAWKQWTGCALWGVMESLGFPGLLRARRRSRKDCRVGQTSPSTQHELNVKRAQRDWGNAQPCQTRFSPFTVYICHLYANTRGSSGVGAGFALWKF